MKNNKYEIDMCNGTLMDKLISFALPLMLSGMLQLMFNAVDIIVVGRFTGSTALAAVGSTTALISTFTNLFIGVSLGANVLAARFYATGKAKEMSETVHTAIALAAISGVVMCIIGIAAAREALVLIDTPDDVIGQAALYLRLYFCGMPFFMLYNYGAAILRAVGDTKRPLMYLIIAGSTNAVLDLVLVIIFKMGRCRCCYRNSYFTAYIVYSCNKMPYDNRVRLQVKNKGFKNKKILPFTDTKCRTSSRNTEYCY